MRRFVAGIHHERVQMQRFFLSFPRLSSAMKRVIDCPAPAASTFATNSATNSLV